MAAADGITVITEELNEFNRAGLPHHVARPGIDAERFRPDLEPPLTPRGARDRPGRVRARLPRHRPLRQPARDAEPVPGGQAARSGAGIPVRLVRLGETELGGVDPLAFGAMRDGVIELGAVGWREIPGYLALADAFVQPGAPNDFNRYRLPSKLPEFLAMGRPVVLPNCNIGHDLERRTERAPARATATGCEIVARVEAAARRSRAARAARRGGAELRPRAAELEG